MRIRAVVANAKGGPEVLKIETVTLPWPRGTSDVLVQLRAAALNPADVFFRELGGYLSGGTPFVLGHDGAGIVKEVGAEVRSVKPGDRVCFCNGGIGGDMGTYAEAAVVPEYQLARIPEGVSDETAAGLPLIAITAWESLYDRARLKPGETALIHGGAGGTGHMAIQLARLRGARPATTISSQEKARIVSDLGAELIINYRQKDFVEAVLAWAPAGIHVALDNAGADVLQRTFKAMAPYGRVVTLMGTPGDDADLSAYNANLTIHNVMMLTPMWRGLTQRLKEQADIVRQSLALVSEKKLRLRIAEIFRLEEAGKAQIYLRSGQGNGKVILSIGG
jgi:NADPH:quinone reductase